MRTSISGEYNNTQLCDELKALDSNDRHAMLKEALGKDFKIILPEGDFLAMKADLGFTWYFINSSDG